MINQKLRMLMLTPLLMITASCAVLDIATLDTAVPLPAGKVQIDVYEAIGVDLTSMSYIDELVEDNVDLSAISLPVNGAGLSYGLDGVTELGGKVWFSSFGGGGKLYLKYLLAKEGKKHLSIIPAFTYVEVLEEYYDDFDRKHQAIGSEVQLLYTYQAAKAIGFTTVLRANYNRYQETIFHETTDDSLYGPYDLFNFGIRENMEVKIAPLILIPEIGIEFVPVVNGRFSVLPVVGIGFGLEL